MHEMTGDIQVGRTYSSNKPFNSKLEYLRIHFSKISQISQRNPPIKTVVKATFEFFN